MNAHDDHDDRRLGADPHVGTVAEDDRHECHADGAVIDELRENGGQQSHADGKEHR